MQKDDEHVEIFGRLKSVEEAMIRMESAITNSTASNERFEKAVSEILKKHEHSIHGNGHKGVLTRQALLEQTTTNNKTKINGLYGLVGTLFVGLIITLLRS